MKNEHHIEMKRLFPYIILCSVAMAFPEKLVVFSVAILFLANCLYLYMALTSSPKTTMTASCATKCVSINTLLGVILYIIKMHASFFAGTLFVPFLIICTIIFEKNTVTYS